MKTIAVDMDGVLANVFQQYVALDERHTGRKRSAENIIRADIMIDDHVKNLDYFIGVTYLFSAPHNHFVSSDKHIRVHSWREAAQILL